jgi:alpha-glucosidase (family GH31 glycosyl hydrolase)
VPRGESSTRSPGILCPPFPPPSLLTHLPSPPFPLSPQGETSLNCTVNKGIDDNGEFNHCEWGIPSRDGWTVYEDAVNFALDENDWWSTTGTRGCLATQADTDVSSSTRSANFPNGTTVADAGACCTACLSDTTCTGGWVFDTAADSPNCWPLAGYGGTSPNTQNRIFGPVSSPSHNSDTNDLYGFFHGHDYRGAIYDFTQISGKTIMVPRYVSGIWWSRWFDINNYDTRKIVDDYESRGIPLDVFVIDMDWHRKNDWSGFTFDEHLFPYAADSMAYLKARGLAITLNIHDASGVNIWEGLFPNLVQALGLPNSSTVVPFNLQNSTVAYAVEDIILGDLVQNKHIDFWWIDWQQGGGAGGMTGGKQNPTIWLDHIRCTDRHRVGDPTRALVLARWGGLGGHRYQVGFSGDVGALTWQNMGYQPYFSATAANVGHGFWSHDIEGPADDMELYTRWIQAGAFSGVMRSHDRGMSGGGCANNNPFDCSIVEVWNVPRDNMEANRLALRMREELLPYVYNGHRAAFDTGVGLIMPMYYFFPEADLAYAMTADGGNGNPITQYMFGPSILFSPVTTPAASFSSGGLATKTTWLPPGTWYDVQSGVLTTVPAANNNFNVTKQYALNEIPMFYVAGDVLPYIPLKSQSSLVGIGSRQYTHLGFRVVPGGASGSTTVYEDDGATTAYLTSNAYAWTTGSYVASGNTLTFTISTNGTSYPAFPASRAYQLALLNGAVPATVTVNGVAVPYVRFGAVNAIGHPPSTHQWYYDFDLVSGLGPVIDVVGLSTSAPVTISVTFAAPMVTAAQMSGVYGAVMHAVWGKANLDLDRSTPGSNNVGPAYISVLASVGDALCYLAGTDVNGFANTILSVPALLANATADVQTDKSPRIPYTLALLGSAMQ